MSCPDSDRTFYNVRPDIILIKILKNGISTLEKEYVHRKIEFVTVNQNSLNYGGGKIVFQRSVVKACFVFRNSHCPILKLTIEDNVRSGRYPAQFCPV